jgi:hypothetical protein
VLVWSHGDDGARRCHCQYGTRRTRDAFCHCRTGELGRCPDLLRAHGPGRVSAAVLVAPLLPFLVKAGPRPRHRPPGRRSTRPCSSSSATQAGPAEGRADGRTRRKKGPSRLSPVQQAPDADSERVPATSGRPCTCARVRGSRRLDRCFAWWMASSSSNAPWSRSSPSWTGTGRRDLTPDLFRP